jgi:hypothetical protein
LSLEQRRRGSGVSNGRKGYGLSRRAAFVFIAANAAQTLRCFTTRRLIRTVAGYRDVLLTDLITVAGLRNAAPGDFKRTNFVASARNGYAHLLVA